VSFVLNDVRIEDVDQRFPCGDMLAQSTLRGLWRGGDGSTE